MKAPATIFNVKILKALLFVLFLFGIESVHSEIIPLPSGFAHNDYRHRHPLFDALGNGYTNIEADIFLVDHHLIIAHIDPFFKSGRTLEKLYLKPLFERVMANGGQVYKGYNMPVILMIDVKTGAESTYKALMPVLEKYKSMLSSYDHGTITPGAVTVVLSGHKPYKMIKAAESRLAFIDEDLKKAANDPTANVYTMASCKYSKLVKWTGIGNMPDNEQQRLCAYVAVAHKHGEKVRLWASPDNDAVWQELLKCGVDLINTDKLGTLKDFLLNSSDKIYAIQPQLSPTGKG